MWQKLLALSSSWESGQTTFSYLLGFNCGHLPEFKPMKGERKWHVSCFHTWLIKNSHVILIFFPHPLAEQRTYGWWTTMMKSGRWFLQGAEMLSWWFILHNDMNTKYIYIVLRCWNLGVNTKRMFLKQMSKKILKVYTNIMLFLIKWNLLQKRIPLWLFYLNDGDQKASCRGDMGLSKGLFSMWSQAHITRIYSHLYWFYLKTP